MSAHLMIAAGYLDLPLSQKLALMKFCDSADDQNRLAYPGIESVRLWAGTRRSRGLDVIRELQECGLVMQVDAGHRGHRATFKVFPNRGDEVFSLAHRQGRACPGAHLFKGAPGVPSAEDIAARIKAMDAEAGPWNGSGAADPVRKGPEPRTQSEGSGTPDPIERVRNDSGKGPAGREKGSGGPDPFSPILQNPSKPFLSPTADAAGDQETAGAGRPDRNDRDDVRVLCDLMVELVTGNGSKPPRVTKAWRDDARLMLDADGRDLDAALDLMRWAAADPFWRANVQSLPKFRKQYDQLRLKSAAPPAVNGRRRSASEETQDALSDLADRLRARHAPGPEAETPRATVTVTAITPPLGGLF